MVINLIVILVLMLRKMIEINFIRILMLILIMIILNLKMGKIIILKKMIIMLCRIKIIMTKKVIGLKSTVWSCIGIVVVILLSKKKIDPFGVVLGYTNRSDTCVLVLRIS